MNKENGLPPTAVSPKRRPPGVTASAPASTLSVVAHKPADLRRPPYAPSSRSLPVKKKPAPGSRDTKRFLDQFGERLVCVRYRYDETNTRRYTTVELIVEEKELLGGYSNLLQPWHQYPSTMVSVHLGYDEVSLRGQIKQAGEKWDSQTKLWRIPYHKAMAIGLSNRIVEEQGD